MSMAAVETEAPAGPAYSLTKAGKGREVAGRRSFLSYRETGITEATGGRLRAQFTIGKEGLSEPTGWHVHVCDAQVVHMLKGWVDLEFAGGEKVRIEAGDVLMIPGGVPHNETATSNEFELLELSIPADMGTRPCDPPA